ncbi:hypothetical protein LCGC14_3126970 [marine sediment metagenome]|uniref:Sulfotransferase domain-containing protein n=1 Tax=marine sediment metagenome TaxID=412755 RepID=A0A0F8W0V2_9ZZZZ
MKYIHIPKWNLAIAVTPKCGSTSIYQAIHDEFNCTDVHCTDRFESLSTEQVRASLPVLFVVRHPLDRFISVWRQRTLPQYESASGKTLLGLTPRQLWDGRDRGDDHWKSQTRLLGCLRYQATIVRLEDLSTYWRFMTPSTVELPHVNATGREWPTELDRRLVKSIDTYYAADIEMYNGAVKWVS